jgi:hypothetical protein
MALAGCIRIPVTVHPESDDKGLPVALPVTPAGSVSQEGVFTPVYPVSVDAPKPPAPFPWGDILNIGLAALGVAGGGYGLLAAKVAGKAKSALAIACSLADRVSQAETDDDVAKAKDDARIAQIAAGVHDLTKQVRGK